MPDNTGPPRLRLVRPTEEPPPPPETRARDPWWPYGWVDYGLGLAEPTPFSNPELSEHLVDGTGRFVIDLAAARAAFERYRRGWETAAAADPHGSHHPAHPRLPRGAAARHAGRLSMTPITLTDTRRVTDKGDSVIDVSGPLFGTIAVGYRLHNTASGHKWYLAIHLAPRLRDQLGALPPTRIVVGGVALVGGVIMHPVYPPAPIELKRDNQPTTQPSPREANRPDHDPSLAPLLKAVLTRWHSSERLATAAERHIAEANRLAAGAIPALNPAPPVARDVTVIDRAPGSEPGGFPAAL